MILFALVLTEILGSTILLTGSAMACHNQAGITAIKVKEMESLPASMYADTFGSVSAYAVASSSPDSFKGISIQEGSYNGIPIALSQESTTAVSYPANWGDRTKAEISLTFDDGYIRSSIVHVLDTLKKHDIKCTFFITGEALERNKELWVRASEEGHQICNHTYSHCYLTKISNEKIKYEIKNWEKAALSELGYDYVEKMKKDFPYIRLPGGAGSKDKRVLDIIKDMKYIPVGWSSETIYTILNHYKSKKGRENIINEEIYKHIIKSSINGSIILLHFNKYDTAKLDDAIRRINEKGLAVKPISDILQQP